MAQSKILLDSNTYFRLARSIHPLLGNEFGGPYRYCLYCVAEFEKELGASQRLQRKFNWVEAAEYRANRQRQLTLSNAEKKEIALTREYITFYARQAALGLSSVDVSALATASLLKVTLVTDDQSMLRTAKEFGIACFSTLQLLKLMLDCGAIDMNTVRAIASYWRYDNDLPANYRRDYLEFFGEPIP